MEPQFLLTQQIQQNAVAIEQNLRILYDPEVPLEYKRVALTYVYSQARQINDLVEGLFTQFQQVQ